jgi:hypothetical protein
LPSFLTVDELMGAPYPEEVRLGCLLSWVPWQHATCCRAGPLPDAPVSGAHCMQPIWLLARTPSGGRAPDPALHFPASMSEVWLQVAKSAWHDAQPTFPHLERQSAIVLSFESNDCSLLLKSVSGHLKRIFPRTLCHLQIDREI